MAKKRFLILLLIIVALLFWGSVQVQQQFDTIVNFILELNNSAPVLAVLSFIALGIVSSIISPFSSVPLVPFVLPIWGNTLTFFYLWLSWVIGAILIYLFARYGLYKVFKDYIPTKKIDFYKKKLGKKTQYALVQLFWFALPGEIPGYSLGLIKYDFKKYILAASLAEGFYAIIAIYLGNALIAQNRFVFFIFLALGFGILGISIYYFKKKLKK